MAVDQREEGEVCGERWRGTGGGAGGAGGVVVEVGWWETG